MTCGTVVSPLTVSSQHVCNIHEVLGNPLTHIVYLHKPNRKRFTVVTLGDIIDMCQHGVFRLIWDMQIFFQTTLKETDNDSGS